MYSILYPDSLTNDNFLYEKPIAKNRCKLTKYNAKVAQDIPGDILSDVDGLITGLQLKIDKKIIDKLSSCKIITRLGVGYDLIDIELDKVIEKESGSLPIYINWYKWYLLI